jgi:hypothetical protein
VFARFAQRSGYRWPIAQGSPRANGDAENCIAPKLASDKKTNFSDFSLRNVVRHGRTEEGNCSYRTPPDA